MTGGTRIIAIGGGVENDLAAVEATSAAQAAAEPVNGHEEWLDEEPVQRPARGWIVPALAALAVAGWSAFFAWANVGALDGVTPQQAISLITGWSIPALLIAVLVLISMRSSRREALRFGDTARLLSDESALLERRLTTVNRELSLAREFLAAQSRELDSLGRTAGEKLSQHAEHLQSLVSTNGAQVDAIASVSTTALGNMEKLRGQLPVVASSAKDMANNIGNAGRTAHGQLSDMIDGFKRLNEFGRASETHVDSLKDRIDTTVEFLGARLDDLHERAENRFADLDMRSNEMRARLGANEDESLAVIRARASALLEEMGRASEVIGEHEAQGLAALNLRLETLRSDSTSLAQDLREGEEGAMATLGQARDRLESSVRETLLKLEALDKQAVESARARIATMAQEAKDFDSRLDDRNRQFAEEAEARSRKAQEAQTAHAARIDVLIGGINERLAAKTAEHEALIDKVSVHSLAVAAQLDDAGSRIAAITAQAGQAESALGNSLQTLSHQMDHSRDTITRVSDDTARLTDDSVRLLELLQASSALSREELPQALAAGEAKLAEIESRIAALHEHIGGAALRSAALAHSLAETREAIGHSLGEIGALQGGLEQGAGRHANQLRELKESLEQLDSESSRIADFTSGELSASLEKLTAAAREAVHTIEQAGHQSVSALAEKLGDESAATIERVLKTRTAEAVGALDLSASNAAETSREAALHLRDQLTRIDELAGNLERRVAQARERAEEQIDGDFSRRVALITESLNSNAIDIAKALSSDVTDTAWASYLRGDRGVFTRRAVRLLDTQEARSVAQVYGEDSEFREHVSRYIHDFEAMLRQLLSTRDGHSLGVTLLSSDMGKLYVALAQAIERLRD